MVPPYAEHYIFMQRLSFRRFYQGAWSKSRETQDFSASSTLVLSNNSGTIWERLRVTYCENEPPSLTISRWKLRRQSQPHFRTHKKGFSWTLYSPVLGEVIFLYPVQGSVTFISSDGVNLPVDGCGNEVISAPSASSLQQSSCSKPGRTPSPRHRDHYSRCGRSHRWIDFPLRPRQRGRFENQAIRPLKSTCPSPDRTVQPCQSSQCRQSLQSRRSCRRQQPPRSYVVPSAWDSSWSRCPLRVVLFHSR